MLVQLRDPMKSWLLVVRSMRMWYPSVMTALPVTCKAARSTTSSIPQVAAEVFCDEGHGKFGGDPATYNVVPFSSAMVAPSTVTDWLTVKLPRSKVATLAG